jgi:hypothetical protein
VRGAPGQATGSRDPNRDFRNSFRSGSRRPRVAKNRNAINAYQLNVDVLESLNGKERTEAMRELWTKLRTPKKPTDPRRKAVSLLRQASAVLATSTDAIDLAEKTCIDVQLARIGAIAEPQLDLFAAWSPPKKEKTDGETRFVLGEDAGGGVAVARLRPTEEPRAPGGPRPAGEDPGARDLGADGRRGPEASAPAAPANAPLAPADAPASEPARGAPCSRIEEAPEAQEAVEARQIAHEAGADLARADRSERLKDERPSTIAEPPDQQLLDREASEPRSDTQRENDSEERDGKGIGSGSSPLSVSRSASRVRRALDQLARMVQKGDAWALKIEAQRQEKMLGGFQQSRIHPGALGGVSPGVIDKLLEIEARPPHPERSARASPPEAAARQPPGILRPPKHRAVEARSR